MEPPPKRACPSGETESREMMKVMVTGGTGLVGKALEEAIANDPRPNEEWVFLSFKDGDLRSERPNTDPSHSQFYVNELAC